MEQHRTRTARPDARSAIALLVALALLLSGCGWFSGGAEPQAEPPSPAPVETAPTSSPVEFVGGPDEIEVGEPQAPVDPGSGLYFVSQLYPVSGPELDQPVLARLVLDNAVPKGTPLTVAARDENDGPWRFLEARLDTDRRHVEFITSELTTFGVLAVDSESVRSGWTQALDAALERDAARPDDVEPPTCENTELARQDGVFRARGWKRQTVGWCFDMMGDQRLLRMTNLRGVPVRVTAPGAEDNGLNGEVARGLLPWSAWLETLGDGAPSSGGDAPPASSLTGTDTFVPPGRTLTVDVDLEPGETLVVTADDDERGRAVQLLHSLARASTDQVRRFGFAKPDPAQVFTTWVEQRGCQRALGVAGDDLARALVKNCLGERSLRRAFDSVNLLLTPVLQQRQTRTEVAERLTTLTQAADQVQQRIQVLRDEPDFSDLVGRFRAAGRTLSIDRDGLVTESVSIDGAPVIALTYQLDEPTTDGARTQASATLRSVQLSSRRQLSGAAPQVGGTGTLVLAQGVVTSAFLQSSYCSPTARDQCAPQPSGTTDDADGTTGSGGGRQQGNGPRR